MQKTKKQIWLSAGLDYNTALSMCPCLLTLLSLNENDAVRHFAKFFLKGYLHYDLSNGQAHVDTCPASPFPAESLSTVYKLPVSHSDMCKCKAFASIFAARGGDKGPANARTSFAACAIVLDSKVCLCEGKTFQ